MQLPKGLTSVMKKTGCFCVKHKKLLLFSFFLLIGIRLWLFLTMNWYVEMDSFYDSRLEMNTATSMLSMKWGGAYSKVALCKGLAYPIFVAFASLTRLSYPVCLFLLVVLASFLFARSLKPIVKNGSVRKLIFLFMLYNPVGLGGEMAYPYRNALVPWTVLIVVSCLIAMYLRRRAELKKLALWALISIVFTGFFWNLREDSIWFLPFVVVGIAVILMHYFIEEKDKKIKNERKVKICFAVLVVCPLISILVWNTGLSMLNKIAYGIYTTEDRTKTYEAKVLGQLIRIDDGVDLNDDYWVSSEAIEKAKEASSTFAGLDLSPFNNWPRYGDYSIWALRDSVSNSGYYVDAASTDELYEQIYRELEEGFRNGVLTKKAGIQLSDTSGIYSMNEVFAPVGTAFRSLINHVIYDEYVVKEESVRNVKNEGDIVYYENILGVNIVRSDEELVKMGADVKTVQENNVLKKFLKINEIMSNVIIKVYNVLSWLLLIGAIIGVVYMFYRVVVKKSFKNGYIELLIFAIGLILLVLLNAYLVGLWGTGFKLTADSGLFKAYTTAETILISVFEVLGVWCMTKIFNTKNNKRKAKK